MIPERDIKIARPTTASRNQPSITEVGKNAKSRLFSYEEAHSLKSAETRLKKTDDLKKKSL